MTDVTDLFTPEELQNNRITFLERILSYYVDIEDVREKAQVIGHKIHGTGGNLGLKQFVRDGINLQLMVQANDDEHLIVEALGAMKEKVNLELSKLR